MSARTVDDVLQDRITEYLSNGGLVNPELMDHAKVRDLLIDCRTRLATLDAERAREREDAKRFAVLAVHVLSGIAIGNVDVSEEACAIAALRDDVDATDTNVTDDDRVQALRVAVDDLRVALDSAPFTPTTPEASDEGL
ncbi:hypothetical protein [Gemmatimonas sp.]|uniref:hypothetical protein n=1 Tax=Gemmatimonas sp. TaxID=1962908 RepID=UPI003341B52E